MEMTTDDRVEISTNSQAIAEQKHQPSGEEPRGDLLARALANCFEGIFFGAVLSQVICGWSGSG